MKYPQLISLLVSVGLLCGAGALHAQTVNITNPIPGAEVASDTNQPVPVNLILPTVLGSNGWAQATAQAAETAYGELSSVSFSNGLTADVFALYHQGDYGIGVAVTTLNTNGLNVGFGLADVQETDVSSTGVSQKKWDFYDTTANLSYDGTVKVPFLNQCGYDLETGAAVNLGHLTQGVWNQSCAILKKTWTVNSNIQLSAFFGMGYMQAWDSSFYLGGGQLVDHLQGKYLFGLF